MGESGTVRFRWETDILKELTVDRTWAVTR
ncbi:hypothetical protein MYCOZU1_00393 [Mycobacterium intracellulare subsp. chimaera]|nr:hypothetical protein MYCOZU1_00393 [Mycobacterium intracellulare subsp. chimaera]